jgi:hypothetical protein
VFILSSYRSKGTSTMKHVISSRAYLRPAGAAVLALLLFVAAGCKNQPAARTDQQMTSDIQAKISGEGALNGQNIQVSVVNGVATLNGAVTDEASRALAANDSGTVNGVRTVVNNLIVQPGQPAAGGVAPRQPTPAPSQAPARDSDSGKRRRSDRNEARPQEAQAVQPAAEPEPVAEAVTPPPPQAPPPPPPPPKPVVKEVTLPEGTVIPIRITETLDSKTAQANDVFHGSLAGDLGIQGVIAVPHGSAVMGRIVDAREAAHFKGAALLSIELTQMTARGRQLTLVTDTFTKQGSGRGKNTAEKAGGGAALGSIIGALAGGGKGAAIGAIAGAGAGTGVNAATRGQQVVIPTETLINFRLQSPVTLTVTIPPNGDQDNGGAQDPQLQRR